MKRMQAKSRRVMPAKGSKVTVKDGVWTRVTGKPQNSQRPLPAPTNR